MPTKTKVPVAHKVIHLIITAATLVLMFVIPSLGYTQSGKYEGLSMFQVLIHADSVSLIIFMVTVAVLAIAAVMALVNKPGMALAFHIAAFLLLAGSTVVAFMYLSNNSFKYYVLYPYIAIAALPFIQIFLYILTMISSDSQVVAAVPAAAPVQTSAPQQAFVPPVAPAPSFVPITPSGFDANPKTDEVEIEVSEITPDPVQDNAVFTNPAQPEYVSPFGPTTETAPAEEEISSVYDSNLDTAAPVDESAPAYGEPAYGESVFDQAESITSEYENSAPVETSPAVESAPVFEDTPAFAENSPVFPEHGEPTPIVDNQPDNSQIAAMYEQAMTGGYTAPVAAEPTPVAEPAPVAPIAPAAEPANDRVLPHVSDLAPMASSAVRPIKQALTEDEEILIHEKIGQLTKQFNAGEVSEEEYNQKIDELRSLL